MTVTLYRVCTIPCLQRRQGEDGCCKAATRNKSRTLLDQRETNYIAKEKNVKLAALVSQPPVMVGHTFIAQADSHDIIRGVIIKYGECLIIIIIIIIESIVPSRNIGCL